MPEALIASSVVDGKTVVFTIRFDRRMVFETPAQRRTLFGTRGLFFDPTVGTFRGAAQIRVLGAQLLAFG